MAKKRPKSTTEGMPEMPPGNRPVDPTPPNPGNTSGKAEARLVALESLEKPKSWHELERLIHTTAPHVKPTNPAEENFSGWRQQRIEQILAELCRRRCEALNLYEPQEFQAPFHACMAHERIVRSGVRAGKSLMVAVECARAVLNKDPFDKWPKTGKFVVVGYDQDHIGRTIYPMLFKAGMFKIIRDQLTGRWRAFRPWDPWDLANKHLAKPAPPLIPQRYIDGRISWVTRSDNIFSTVRLTTGWEIWGYSSRAKPPQGFRADGYWFDEDVEQPEWVDEALARISDTDAGGGRLFWSARPHSKNLALLHMSQRAWQQAVDRPDDPDIVEFKFSPTLNRHIDKEARARFSRAMKFQGREQSKMLDEGEYTIDEWKVYPELSKELHEVSTDSAEFVNGQLPADWSRYAVLDPGWSACAILFCAVPPSSFGDYLYIEDELYLLKCPPDAVAKKMAEKVRGRVFQAWIIDVRGSQSTQVDGHKIKKLYEEAFAKAKISSELTGSGFYPTNPNRAARQAMTHQALAERDYSPPRIRIVEERVPMLWHNVDCYHKKRKRDPVNPSQWVITDEADGRGSVHQAVNLEYLCSLPKVIKYREPTVAQLSQAGQRKGWAMRYLKDKLARKLSKQHGQESDYVNLGPGKNRQS